MVDAFDDVYFYSFVEVKNNNYSFVEVKNNNSRYYTYLEDNKSSYVSLLEYESDIPQKFDPWNKTQTEVLTVEEFESTTKDFVKKLSKDYSFYTKDAAKEAAEESVKSYKKSLKEKRTYVKTGNEYTLSIYDKDGELQSRVTYKRMSKWDSEERWDDYKDIRMPSKIIRKIWKNIVINMITTRITLIMVMAVILNQALTIAIVAKKKELIKSNQLIS